MGITKTEAILLHVHKQGETSKVVTALTPGFGKMSLMAKGARNTRSKYLGVLDTFNHISLVIYRKEGRGMQYISQADIINPFPALHSQLGKMSLAAIAAEIIDKNEPAEHPGPELFFLLKNTLESLEKEETGLRNILRSFQLKYVEHSGLLPILERCHGCGKQEATATVYFDMERGFYHCADCGIPSEVNFSMSGKALEFVRWLTLAPVANAFTAAIAPSQAKQIDDFIYLYFQYHFEHIKNLKSLKYLNELSHNLKTKR